MNRFFSVASPLQTEWQIAHDPCTGLTHVVPEEKKLLPGRQKLNDDELKNWSLFNVRNNPLDFPLSVCWSPIVYCNLHCPHCLDDKSIKSESRSTRREIADTLATSEILGVDISGGEPLLIPELPELLTRLRQSDLVVSVTTNGWFLTKLVYLLVGLVDAVRISLDGPDKDSHDRWRGEGSFQRAIEGLRAARAHQLPLQIQTVAMASTVHKLQNLVDLAEAEGAVGVSVLQMLPIGEGARIAHSEMIGDDELAKIVNSLRVPKNISVRARYRMQAEGFTVIRADGSIYKNGKRASSIERRHALIQLDDLRTNGLDGSA